MPDLIIIRPDERFSARDVERIMALAEGLSKKLAEADDDVPVMVAPGLTLYYLRPGESTDMLDAKAEAIRAGVSVEA